MLLSTLQGTGPPTTRNHLEKLSAVMRQRNLASANWRFTHLHGGWKMLLAALGLAVGAGGGPRAPMTPRGTTGITETTLLAQLSNGSHPVSKYSHPENPVPVTGLAGTDTVSSEEPRIRNQSPDLDSLDR